MSDVLANIPRALSTPRELVVTAAEAVWHVTKQAALLPARVITRMRLLDELLRLDAERQAAAITAAYQENGQEGGGSRARTPFPTASPMPGPWNFFTSGYAAGLLMMTLLLNRIQHVVQPRHPLAHALADLNLRGSYQTRSRFWPIFPIDMTSTTTRAVMRSVTTYLLCRAFILWLTVTLQTAGNWPSWGFLQPLGDKAAEIPMEDLCWTTYIAVCAGLLVAALSRGLEGGMNSGGSPFNLFGYAFMLFIYASPVTHSHKAQDRPSRPDVHSLIMCALPLLQLTIIHIMGISQKWSRRRLLPTSICSLLKLAHFHYVILFSDTPYPLVNYATCALESLLLFVTALTAGLHALTQLLLEGQVNRPLFGHAGALRPHLDEDFSIALLRAGTASLDATAVAGLGNAVGTVSAPAPRGMGGTLELDAAGVASFAPAAGAARGLANEIKSVKALTSDGELFLDHTWYRELATYGLGILRFLRGLGIWLWSCVRGRRIQRPTEMVRQRREMRARSVPPPDMPSTDGLYSLDDEDENAYSRFLAGDDVSSDEDDFVPRSRGVTPFLDAEDEAESAEDSADEAEAAALFADHLREPHISAPLLLAHVASPGSALTRRRYRSLTHTRSRSVTPAPAPLPINASHKAPPIEDGAEDDLARRQTCVICLASPREVILWPCRCLALCEDCRLNLATRAAASKHACPCCRQHVDGYSRIFIP